LRGISLRSETILAPVKQCDKVARRNPARHIREVISIERIAGKVCGTLRFIVLTFFLHIVSIFTIMVDVFEFMY
jgi:hypothetical protein